MSKDNLKALEFYFLLGFSMGAGVVLVVVIVNLLGY